MNITPIQVTNFQAMKPNQFKGFDYACVRKFKAPVEKFENEKYFQGWAYDTLQKIVLEKLALTGKNEKITERRRDAIFEWRKTIGISLETAPLALIIVASILKDINKHNNEALPPPLSEKILRQTTDELKAQLEINKDYQFNFNKLYQKKFKEHYLNTIAQNFTGWITIPSQQKDKTNFEDNLTKLKILSNKTWCTRNYYAKIFLSMSSLDIWLQNGEPKIALRINNNQIEEIQGENNDDTFPPELFDIVHSHICESGYVLTAKGFNAYHHAKNLSKK